MTDPVEMQRRIPVSYWRRNSVKGEVDGLVEAERHAASVDPLEPFISWAGPKTARPTT